jgi:hypothetical protein
MFTPYPPPSPPMHRWRGVSGEWYWFSILGIDAIWDLEGIVYILAQEAGRGLGSPDHHPATIPERGRRGPAAESRQATTIHSRPHAVNDGGPAGDGMSA